MYIDFLNKTDPDITPFVISTGEAGIDTVQYGHPALKIVAMHNAWNGTVYTPSNQISGAWECAFRFEAHSIRTYEFEFMSDTNEYGAGGYYVSVNDDGTLQLAVIANQSRSILINSTWIPDTENHIIHVTRDLSGRFDFYFDGTLIGTVTDNTITSFNYMILNLWAGQYTPQVYIDHINIQSLNPICTFTMEKTSNPLEVQFTPTVTTLTDDPVTYLWDFGDGYTSTEENPTHTYQETSTFTATLTVTNRFGSSDPYNLTRDIPLGVFFFNDANDLALNNILFESVYPNKTTVDQLINIGSKNWNITDIDIQAYAVPNNQIPAVMQKASIGSNKYIELSLDKETYVKDITVPNTSLNDYTPLYIRADIPNYAVTGGFLCGLIGTVNYNGPIIHGYGAWSKYTTIPVTGSVDGTKYNYPIHITIEYASHMNTDFSDIRFTLNDGTGLDYDLTYKEDSNFAEFIVNIPKLYQSPYITHIFIVSGNSSATDASNPSAVYQFFDDFTNLDKWTVNGNATVSSGNVNLHYDTANASISTLFNPTSQFKVTARYKKTTADHNRGYVTFASAVTGTASWTPLFMDYFDSDYLYWGVNPTTVSLDVDTWYLWEWVITDSEYIWNILSDDGETTLLTESSTLPPQTLNALIFLATNSTNSDFDLDWVKVEQTTTHPPTIGSIGSWENNSTTGSDTETIILQGAVLDNNPENPPKPDQNIILDIDNVYYPKWKSFDIDIRNNDAASTFSIVYNSREDLPIYSGQEIVFKEQFGDPKGFYSGLINNVNDHNEPAKRVYTLKGINNASDLIVQPFSIAAAVTNNTLSTSMELIDLILDNTNVTLGPCPNIAVTGIVNDNTKYNGFAGNWKTKADALTDLCTLISRLIGKNLSWFVDKDKLLHIFYTNVIDASIGITIRNENPRRGIIEIEDSCENVINDQVGTGAADNSLYVHMQDTDSINGYTDPNTGIQWPALGVQSGSQIQDTSIITQTDLNTRVENELELHSKRIFTATITLSRFPDVYIGQPLYLPDNYKVKGMTFVVTQISYHGESGKRNLKIVATTDPAVVGPLSPYEQVNIIAQTVVQQYTPVQAVVTQLPSAGAKTITVKPGNQNSNINIINISGAKG